MVYPVASTPPPTVSHLVSGRGVGDRPSYLVHTIGHGLQRELPGPIHCLAVVCGAPASAVDVDQLRHVADGGGLDDVRHERLVQHPDACGHVEQRTPGLGSPVHRRQGGGGGLGPWVLGRVGDLRCSGDTVQSKDHEEGTDGPTGSLLRPTHVFADVTI